MSQAAALRALHRPGEPLVLPNAWDAGSARAVVAAGFPAVATSSSAMAESLGYADHEAAPAAEMLDAVARIAAAVAGEGTPVTADLERGYGMSPTELVHRLAATGAVGCNLEDSDPRTGRLLDIPEQADYLAAVRAAATEAGVDLVINARIDVYVRDTPGDRLTEAVSRARAYLAAGADCAYPILATSPADIATLTRESGGPVNVLFTPRSPGLAELAALGAARVSMGGGLYNLLRSHLSTVLATLATGHSPYAP